MEKALKGAILSVPDFPKKGILFRDITPLLGNAKLFQRALAEMGGPFKGRRLDYVAGIESRGFLFAGALALKQGAGLVPIRKKGKLPRKTFAGDYTLEYGQDAMEIHEDAFSEAKGKNVLLVDDVLATGETARCAASLIEQAGGKVAGISVLIELTFLNGREKLKRYPFHSVIRY